MTESSTYSQVLLALATVVLTVSGAVAAAPATTTESSAEDVSATIVHDGDALWLHAVADQFVTVETTADAGTELTVVLREDGNFVDAVGATVSEDGTATATLDLRTFEPGTSVSVGVQYEQETLAQVEGEIAAESTASEPTATPTTYDESEFAFTSTAATTDDASAGEDATTEETTLDETGGIGVPGFGGPAALAALLAALALARRRQ